eukprot:1006563-Ditylum_brightwellii.AAC.1
MAVNNNSNITNNSQHQNNRGGRGGGHGGHGGHGNPQPVMVAPGGMKWQQPWQQQKMPMMPMQNRLQPNIMLAFNQQRQSISYRKCYNNMDYCWTHGSDMPNWHTS